MDFSKYTVVTSDDFGKFEDRVNQLLGEGWKLQGGVTGTALPDTDAGLVHVQWSQALVLPGRTVTKEAASEKAEPLPIGFESVEDIVTLPDPERPAYGSGPATPS
jgi:hypothetical protein